MVSRLKKAFTNIPATLSEVASFITAIAEKQRAINTKKREAKKKVEAINKELAAEVKVLKNERDTFFNALFAFAQPRKEEFTEFARSIKLETGTFGWRWTPPAVALDEGVTDADVIRLLEKKGLGKYVRIIKELDREAMLRDRPEVKHVSYEQREEFFAKPKLLKVEGTAEELVTEAIDVVE